MAAGLALIALAAALASCAATQVPVARTGFNELPGFWRGLWHGIIAPIAFVVSLFTDAVRVYAVPNGGRWYDFGFMIGIGAFSHGVWRGDSARRTRRDAKLSRREG